MKNRNKYIALAITTGILFLTCTNPFFPGIVSKSPNDNNPVTRNSGPVTYTATFHVDTNVVFADDGSKENSIVVFHLSEGAKIPKLPALIRPGYSFGGWYTDNGIWNLLWNFDTAITGNIDLYARWVPEPPPGIKVKFNTNLGIPQPGEQNLANGTLVVEPPPITKDGYAFDGWYKEADFRNKWNFTTDAVTADPGSTITLYAKWVEVHYTVRFEANGGNPVPVPQNSNGGKIVIPPPMTKPSAAFAGWFKDKGCTDEWDFAAKVTSNMTLYAKWIAFPIKYYTVHFEANGGRNIAGEAPADQHIVSGGKVNVPPADMTKGSDGFGGWYTDAACTTGNEWNFTIDTVNADTTLYARWVPPPSPIYTVRFEADGGLNLAGMPPENQQIASGGKVTRPRPVFKVNYGFGGWYTDAACTTGNEWNFDNAVTGNMTLYAKWILDTCVVKYHSDGGTTPPHDEVTVAKGSKAVMPRPMSKTGYFFGGWYRESTFKTLWDFDNDTVNVDTDLYAKWIDIYYTITFNEDGGIPAPDQQIVIHDGKVVMPSPMSKTGYAFIGWYKEETCTNKWKFDTDTVTSNTTLYANWVVGQYTVTFNGNEGSPVPAPQNVAYGGKAAMPPPMSKDSFAFAGWFKDSDFADAWNFDTDTVSGNIILYAKWIVPPKYYTVTFNTNSAITTPSPQTIIEGGKITEPLGSAMKWDGYSFRGWFTEDNRLWNFATDLVDKDINLRAEWNIIYYTVIFNMGIIDPVSSNQNFIYGGGDQSPANQSIVFGGRVIEPLNMTRDSMAIVDGYGFDGWYWCADSKTPADSQDTREWIFENYTVGSAYVTTGTTNINLYPKWIKDQKYLDYPDSYPSVDNGNLVWVRKGNFSMGSSKSVSSGYPVPRPVHQVTLTQGFFIGMYPITQQQYMKVRAYNPSSITTNSDNNPVNRVTWLDAIVFCNKLTDMENAKKNLNLVKVYDIDETSIVYADGSKWPTSSNKTIISAKVTINWDANGYRLPTEAEWEYTARNGKGSPGDFDWSGSNTASEVAWYGGTGGTATDRTTHPVGLLKPNSLRTFDMSGNVCEWCWDEFSSGYYTTSSPSITDPKGPGLNTVVINNPGNDTYRVRRGGSWNHVENNTRTFLRDSFQPTDTNMTNFWTIGFRVVRGPLVK